jgi:sigma-B regulation protein RsbU (phosphoserine phosphatase)
MTLGALVIFFFMHRSIRSATKPLGFLSESTQEVAKGNFDTKLPTFRHHDEITQLRDSFDTMQQSLKRYVEELKETATSKATIESELNIAHHIQMAMLPKTFPAFPHRDEIEIYGMLTPAKSVGGDLYDFFLRDDELFFCIGDVSGKGVPASLVMAVTRTLFRNVVVRVESP